MRERLSRERERLLAAWEQFVISRERGSVEPGLLDSWSRSSVAVPAERVSAPVDDERDTEQDWRNSPLEYASRPLRDELQFVAGDADLIVAIADASGKLLWTCASRRMQGLAQQINFVPGGHWDEASVGTNALGLALRTRQPVRVFAAEHYVQTVHDWVCWSSPITDPNTGELLGVVDFSTTWEHTSPLGLTSVKYYAQQMQHTLRAPQTETLQLRLCGRPVVLLGGRPLALTPRQQELLAVLVLCPDGLTLDALHAHVYGDQPISMSTLKAEVSLLRAQLGGHIASRPYRLTLDVQFDVQQVERALVDGRVSQALDLYGGPLMPLSASPMLTYWREYLDAALRDAVVRGADPQDLWRYATRFEDDLEVLSTLHATLPVTDPRLPVVRARLGALGGLN